jgi:hypothetical protein
MDISKAFDKVRFRGLLVKLENNGIRGGLLNWFASYLCNRSQKVTINGECSKAMKIEAGVPQGSVLGPILFLIYINHISEGSLCPTNLFADDASLMESNESLLVSVENVSNDLARIERWAAKWLITFNFSNKNNPPLVPQMFCGHYIQQVDSHCHLGMTFTKNLNWNQHVDNVQQNIMLGPSLLYTIA